MACKRLQHLFATIGSFIIGTAGGAGFEAGSDLEQVLAWFPADTETLCVMNGPFRVPPAPAPGRRVVPTDMTLSDNLARSILMPLGYYLPREMYLPFAGRTVVLAVEGSKKFKTAGGSINLYEGVHVCIFKDPIRAELVKYLEENGWTCENRIWEDKTLKSSKSFLPMHVYLTLPSENCVVLGTNLDLINEVLGRADSRASRVAMPISLPEWKYLDAHPKFWAIRHYRKPTDDILSPLFVAPEQLISDDQAIGLVFQYDPTEASIAQVTYLSRNSNAHKLVKERIAIGFDRYNNKPAAVQEIDAMAVCMRIPIESPAEPRWFLFWLDALIGHSVNV